MIFIYLPLLVYFSLGKRASPSSFVHISPSTDLLMSLTGKYVILVVVTILGLAGYFHLFFTSPSTSRNLYIQTVTLTRKIPLEVFAQYEPSIIAPCMFPLSPCGVFQAMFADEEIIRMRVAADAAIGKRDSTAPSGGIHSVVGGVGVDASHVLSFDVPEKESKVADRSSTGLVTVPDGLRNAHLRFSSKHHVNHQLHEMWHYPLCYLLCSRAQLCDLPWMTANLVTFSHLGIGLIAAVCFFRASKHWDSHIRTTLRGGAELSDDSTSSMAHETPKAEPPVSDIADFPATTSCEGTPSAPQKRINRTLSASVVGYKGGGGDVTALEMPEMHTPPTTNLPPQGNIQETTGLLTIPQQQSLATNNNNGSPLLGATSAGRRRRWILVATLLFTIRNLLDTLDGVVARYQRLQAAGGDPLKLQPSPLVFGINGHTIDTVCDFVGGFACCLGILSIMWSQPVLISRLPRLLLTKIGLRQTIRHHAALPKWVAFSGLLFTSVSAAGWDFMMIKYVNLFDVHSDGNDAVFSLEQNPQVRLNQFLWSLLCADCLFTYLTIGLVADRLWLVLQTFVFIGYPLVALLMCHSLYVWYAIVAASPDAVAAMKLSA